MLITGLVASREIWRHGIRRTIRKQSQPSRPIVHPPRQIQIWKTQQKKHSIFTIFNIFNTKNDTEGSYWDYDTLHPQSYQCQSPESGLIQNHLGLNKTGLCPRLETTMTRQGLGAPSLSLLANPTILHSTLPFYIQPYHATNNLTMPHSKPPCFIQPHQATENHIKQSLSCPSVQACGLDLSCIRTRSVRSKEASPPAGLDIRTRVDLIMDLYTLFSYLS